MLTRENTGLVVVDIQGKLARIVHDSESTISNSANLIGGAKALGLPILWLEQNPEKLGATVPELQTLLAPSQPLSKYTFNGCLEPAFTQAVRDSNVTTWLVCGIEAHICVYQTTLGLVDMGLDVELVCDAIASRAVANKELAISKLASKGVGMTNVEMCLYELVEDCRTPEFKDILKLIR